MLGVLLFVVYLAMGIVMANLLLPEKRAMTRAWAGGVFGIVALMWSNIPFSFLFGFTILSHLLGLLLSIGLCVLIYVLTAGAGAGSAGTAAFASIGGSKRRSACSAYNKTRRCAPAHYGDLACAPQQRGKNAADAVDSVYAVCADLPAKPYNLRI